MYLSPTKDFLGPMTLTIQALQNDGFTDMHLCQDGYQTGDDWDWYYDAVHKAWPEVLVTLKNYLGKF